MGIEQTRGIDSSFLFNRADSVSSFFAYIQAEADSLKSEPIPLVRPAETASYGWYGRFNVPNVDGDLLPPHDFNLVPTFACDFNFGNNFTLTPIPEFGLVTTSDKKDEDVTRGNVTPSKRGKLRRPKNFRSAEAARLWSSFAAKASQFDPQKDLGPEFLAKVKEICGPDGINCDYKDLLSVMNMESGLNPYIPNLAGYGAYGLIQFQPDTLRELGYQPEDLLKMSATEQLDVVKKYYMLSKRRRKIDGPLTTDKVYGLVLAPAHVNKDCYYAAGTKAYRANQNLDKKFGNNDGRIDGEDLRAAAYAKRVNENIFLA